MKIKFAESLETKEIEAVKLSKCSNITYSAEDFLMLYLLPREIGHGPSCP